MISLTVAIAVAGAGVGDGRATDDGGNERHVAA